MILLIAMLGLVSVWPMARLVHPTNSTPPGLALMSCLTSTVFCLTWLRLEPHMSAWFGLGLSWWLLCLSWIDIEHGLLPDRLTLPGIWLGLLASLILPLTSSEDAIKGAIAGYGFLWALYWVFWAFTGKEGLGFGDFKLLSLLGACLGWRALPFIVVCSSLLGSGVGLWQVATRRISRDASLPFGPYLALAGWLYLILYLS